MCRLRCPCFQCSQGLLPPHFNSCKLSHSIFIDDRVPQVLLTGYPCLSCTPIRARESLGRLIQHNVNAKEAGTAGGAREHQSGAGDNFSDGKGGSGTSHSSSGGTKAKKSTYRGAGNHREYSSTSADYLVNHGSADCNNTRFHHDTSRNTARWTRRSGTTRRYLFRIVRKKP